MRGGIPGLDGVVLPAHSASLGTPASPYQDQAIWSANTGH